jgi:hypothetical protein
LPVRLHCHLHVGLGEGPCLLQVAVADAVSLLALSVTVHVHLLQYVHALQLVQVTIDGGLGGLELDAHLLHQPHALHVAKEAFGEHQIGHRVLDVAGAGLGIVTFGQIADLLHEEKGHLIHVLQRGEGRVADDAQFEHFDRQIIN